MTSMIVNITNKAILDIFNVRIKNSRLEIEHKENSSLMYQEDLYLVPNNLLNILQSTFFPGSISILENFLNLHTRHHEAEEVEFLIRKHFFYRGLIISINPNKSYFFLSEKKKIIFKDGLSKYLFDELKSGIFLKSQFDFLIDYLLSVLKNESNSLDYLVSSLRFEDSEWYLEKEMILRARTLYDVEEINTSIFKTNYEDCTLQFSQKLKNVVNDISVSNGRVVLSAKLLKEYSELIEIEKEKAKQFKNAIVEYGNSLHSRLSTVTENLELTNGDGMEYNNNDLIESMFKKNQSFDQMFKV